MDLRNDYLRTCNSVEEEIEKKITGSLRNGLESDGETSMKDDKILKHFPFPLQLTSFQKRNALPED